ncbi:MAG: alpha/beta fold hydrolase [Planctomycetes bacterium]|nr:alpha/beta fold hydrolase [Planctomycetota bacterium]
METCRVPTSDGWTLAAEHREPEGSPAGVVVLAGHALLANRRSLDRPRGGGLVSRLAARGFRVYTFDVRGHGESRPRTDEGGRWTYDDIVREDFPALVQFVSRRHPEEALAVLGHSLTGHAALATLAWNPGLPVSAAVTFGANEWLRRLEPDRRRWREKILCAAAMQVAAALFGRLPARLLRQGSDDEARAVIEQLAWWVRRNRWLARDGFDYLAGLAEIRVPVLAISGAADRLLCTPESFRIFHEHLTSTRVNRIMVRGCEWGVSKDPGHMDLVLDPIWRPVWDRAADWMLENVHNAHARAESHHGEHGHLAASS